MSVPVIQEAQGSGRSIRRRSYGRQVASLRAQSIRLQLDGQLSAVYEDQVPESRVDASDVDVMDMSRIV